MKKSRSLTHGAGAMALALAGMLGMGTVSIQNVQAMSQQQTAQTPIKAPGAKQATKKNSISNEIGGIPIVSMGGAYGLSPKEYGMRFGNGGSKRSNKLRYAHNAKLKRRAA